MPKGVYERKSFTKEHKRKIGEARTGEKNPNWKGGQATDDQGYIRVLIRDHPRANGRGYVRRSHLAAEKTLGRYLFPNEITHHKNEIRDDDRPENIEVMTRGKHTSLHKNKYKEI